MSNIIEKITLYDLLGYTLPGTVLVGAWSCAYLISAGWELCSFAECKDYAGYILAALLVSGYAIGIALSEVTYLCSKWIEKTEWFQNGNEIDKIGYTVIAEALANAGLIQKTNETSNKAAVKKYMKTMHAMTQTDSRYSRLHNYASSELLCRNLAFDALGCGAAVFKVTGNVAAVLCGIFLAVVYIIRWRKQYWNKKYYVVSWFVEKYRKASQ